MRAIVRFTLCYLLLRVYLIPTAAAALLTSTVLAIQSNQSLDLETPSLTSTLSAPPFPPKPPFPPRPPLPPAPTETGHIECFDPPQKAAKALNLKDCDSTIEVILHASPGPLEILNFSRSGGEGSYKVPMAWGAGNCQIIISSSRLFDAWAEYRYVDIVVAAQNVLKVCLPRSKFALGGRELSGRAGFYVAVNGRATGNPTEDGNGTNATPLGMGTAVNVALPTGVSALVRGDELDEDGALSVM